MIENYLYYNVENETIESIVSPSANLKVFVIPNFIKMMIKFMLIYMIWYINIADLFLFLLF